MKYFPNNTISRYTTRLQTLIELDGAHWECALTEIQYTKSWFTVPRSSGKFAFSCANCTDFVPPHEPARSSDYTVNMTIPFGYYETMYDIVNALNESISENMPVSSIPIPDKNGTFVMTKVERDKWPRFKYNEVKRKVNVH
jgi:hypothetical protein